MGTHQLMYFIHIVMSFTIRENIFDLFYGIIIDTVNLFLLFYGIHIAILLNFE